MKTYKSQIERAQKMLGIETALWIDKQLTAKKNVYQNGELTDGMQYWLDSLLFWREQEKSAKRQDPFPSELRKLDEELFDFLSN